MIERGLLGWKAIHSAFGFAENEKGELVQIISMRRLKSWRLELMCCGAITKMPGKNGKPPRIIGWPGRLQTFIQVMLRGDESESDYEVYLVKRENAL